MATIESSEKGRRSSLSDPNVRRAELLSRSGTNDPKEFMLIGIAAAKAGKYERGLVFLAEAYNRLTRPPETKASDPPPTGPTTRGAVPASALSYYGLCLALQLRQYREGAAFCELAISNERSVAEHYHNLARIWQKRGDEQRAQDAVKRGLAAAPDDKPLRSLRDEMSKKGRPPEVPLLTRVGSLGQAVGRLLGSLKPTKAGPADKPQTRKRKSGERRSPR